FLPEGASLFDGSAVITRTGDEYSCTCKSWKDAKAAGIATTCKHLREAFGVQYEAARVKLMKKFRARLPSGLGTVTVPETIAAETKQPDAVVQTTEDTSLLKESEPDRISDVNSNPRSITADSSQNLNVESNAPSTLKEATTMEPVDSVGIAVTDKVSDKSSELEPKPASKKSRKTPAKKPVPQLPHAKSVERDSATTSDLSSESRATGTLQEQEDTPPKEVPAKESKSKEKKQTSGRPSKRNNGKSVQETIDFEMDLGNMYGPYMRETAAETVDVQQQSTNSATVDWAHSDELAGDVETSNAHEAKSIAAEDDKNVDVQPKNAKKDEMPVDVGEAQNVSIQPKKAKTPKSKVAKISKGAKESEGTPADDATPIDVDDDQPVADQPKKDKKSKPAKTNKSEGAKESEGMSAEPSAENLQSISKPTGDIVYDPKPIDAEEERVDAQPKNAKKSKTAKISKGVKKSEEMPAETSPQKLESIAETAGDLVDDNVPTDAEDDQNAAVQPKKAKNAKTAKSAKGAKESEEPSADPPRQLESIAKSSGEFADDANPIDAGDVQTVDAEPKKAKKSKAAKKPKGVKESKEISAEASHQNLESVAKSIDHVADDMDAGDESKADIQPKRAKKSKTVKTKASEAAKESEEVSSEPSTEILESIAKRADHVADDASTIDAEDDQIIPVQPKMAKKSKLVKPSKGAKESEEMSAESSPPKLESLTDTVAMDAGSLDAGNDQSVDMQPKRAKKSKGAKPSKIVEESKDISDESSAQKFESIDESAGPVAEDGSLIVSEDDQSVTVQPTKAKKSKTAKTSKGVKESEAMSDESSAQNLESVAKSTDHDATPMDGGDGPTVKAKKSKTVKAKNSESVKESGETSAESSHRTPESIAESTKHVADDAKPIDAEDGPKVAAQPNKTKKSKSAKTKKSEGVKRSDEKPAETSPQLDSEVARGEVPESDSVITGSVEKDSVPQNDGANIPKAPAKANKAKSKSTDSTTSEDFAIGSEDAESMLDASAEDYTSKGRENRAKIKSQQPALLLAQKYDPEKTDPTGYWVSEKLDGIRTFWDHERGQFFSRLGNPFTPPDWFKEAMPKHWSLDGELFAGRGKFIETISVVKTINSPDWEKVQYYIFDSPSMTELTCEDRMQQLKQVVASSNCKHLKLLPQELIESKEHVEKLLKQIESKGGEGLMLRKPGSLYVGKRSSTLLKVKSFYDAEAVVIGHEPGRGKNSRVTGSLRCRMESGKEFRIGTGLSDSDRETPPAIGAIVTYRFQELTRDGIPRFPSFVGERVDADRASDATVRIVQ
ncbi:hypothetical protein HDU81_005938, partial [Chytriomyces hyalinus]